MNRVILGLVFVLVTVSICQTSWARSFRVAQIPNGAQIGCDLCHEAGNTGYVNPFGVQVLSHLSGGDVKWNEMWSLDADGDGYTNGQEMGDPSGRWSMGQADPSFRVTHPGYADQNLCNNGVLEDIEQCDRNEMRGETCVTLGFATGALGCNALCQYDLSGCSNCGNGIVEKGDQCDGDDMAGVSCVALGYDGGDVSCSTSCRVSLSGCEGDPTPFCGDGIRVRGEECEGVDLGQRNCTALGWSGGELRCSDMCVFDTSLCSGTGPERDRLTNISGTNEPPTNVEADSDADAACSAVVTSRPLPQPMALLIAMGLLIGRRRR